MKENQDSLIIREECLELLKLVENEEQRRGKPMNVKEINDFLSPLIEKQSQELIRKAKQRLKHHTK